VTTQTTTDIKRDDRELADKVWDILLRRVCDHTTRQLLKAERQMRRYVDEDNAVTAKAKLNPSGYGLAWLAGQAAVTSGLNVDMERNDPSRLLQLIQDLLVARADEDEAFDTAWSTWMNMEHYAEAEEEPDDLDYPIYRSQALGLISGAKEKEM